jgi:uncharacterized damage-inducible protein DinB
MPDRRTPFVNSDERTTLLAFLDYLREAVIVKASGLDDAAVRRSPVGSGTSLLGLVKHLTRVEVAWFQWALADFDVRVPDDALMPTDTAESVLAGYRDAIARSNAAVEAAADLDQLCVHRSVAPERMSVRWVLVHMIEETGRHAGHADILREQIDGETGR